MKYDLLIFAHNHHQRPCGILALFINSSAVAAMLPIMAKLSTILKSECVNTLEFLPLLEKG